MSAFLSLSPYCWGFEVLWEEEWTFLFVSQYWSCSTFASRSGSERRFD